MKKVLELNIDNPNIWLTSDRHLWHEKVLKYDPARNFKCTESMDEYIIYCIEQLPMNTILIFCWDLCFWNIDRVDRLMWRLSHLQKYWIFWNHDSNAMKNKLSHHFIDTCDTMIINGSIHINHFPPIDYQQVVKYHIDKYDYYIHWHTHKPWKKHYWYDISYNWWRLLYSLKDITWRV
jgi:calcineurin-like phosphoesterase family protein